MGGSSSAGGSVGAGDGGRVGRDGFSDGVGEHVDQAAPGGQFLVQFAAPPVPGGLQVFEADAGRGQLGRHRHAQELAAVEHPDLGQVPRVVADGDLFPDVGGQRQRQVAQAVAVDPVAVHLAGGGHGQQQQVQLLQGFGHPGQPPGAEPPAQRRLPGLRVDPVVVVVRSATARPRRPARTGSTSGG